MFQEGPPEKSKFRFHFALRSSREVWCPSYSTSFFPRRCSSRASYHPCCNRRGNHKPQKVDRLGQIGVPQKWMVKIRENPIKMGWFGGFSHIFGNTHIALFTEHNRVVESIKLKIALCYQFCTHPSCHTLRFDFHRILFCRFSAVLNALTHEWSCTPHILRILKRPVLLLCFWRLRPGVHKTGPMVCGHDPLQPFECEDSD